MHSILFEAKRAFQSSVYRLALPMLRPFGLTPARFDLLYALLGTPDPYEQRRLGIVATRQSDLRRVLGVSRTTVSRLVVALEHLGLVRRWRELRDTRQMRLELTKEGHARVKRVLRELLARGLVDLALDHALAEKRWHAPAACIEAKENLEAALLRFRHALGDAARLVYPWHPDD